MTDCLGKGGREQGFHHSRKWRGFSRNSITPLLPDRSKPVAVFTIKFKNLRLIFNHKLRLIFVEINLWFGIYKSGLELKAVQAAKLTLRMSEQTNIL